MEKDPFKEYLRESEPDRVHKGYAWSTAIGLQAVDGLEPSQYLIDTAIANIEGKITIKEAQNLIDSYYEERPVPLSDDERTEEADKVSSRIAEILSETAFSFTQCRRKAPGFSYGDIRRLLFCLKLVDFYCVR